ncbi:hypothetical protein AADG42_14850 [Ammonicoccus fulvus]|uniref:GNAT family N-acetyltransferase n=1 Tax=Ammonicoccus fulvus TaxID=3138240 RepID=A0ABZ3FQZ9_9ACTN
MRLSVHASLGTPGSPSQAAVDAAAVWAADEYAELGHDDFAYSARELAATYADQARQRRVMVLAHEDDRCVGLASVEFPLTDNQHMISVEFRLDPEVEAAPFLDALWSGVEANAGDGRDTVVTWTPSSRLVEDGLRPKTGAGLLRRTAGNEWFAARGFELEQVEVASTLQVAESLGRAGELEATAAAAGEAYDIVSWLGPTPPELLDAMAVQRVAMSTDVPLGEIDMEPEVWDAARVQGDESVELAMGRLMVWTIAVEKATGEVAAHTLLKCPDLDRPEVAYQEDTLVRKDHRGHRLGMRVKAANLRQLAAARPGVRRIHTWNADENDWMLAINREMGVPPLRRWAAGS